MVDALAHEHPQVRECAAAWLGERKAEVAVPALSKALEDEYFRVRYRAAVALGTIGPAADEATPALERLLAREKELTVSQAAAEALKKIREKEKAEK